MNVAWLVAFDAGYLALRVCVAVLFGAQLAGVPVVPSAKRGF